jgi:glycosyltransferase involved in cell wall biosynthesis
VKVLVVGTGGSIVSGVSAAADEMVRALEAMEHQAERLSAGTKRRRRSNTVNLENVLAAMQDSIAVMRAARRGRVDLVWIDSMGVPALPALRTLGLVVGARLAGRRAIVRFHAFGLEDALASGGRSVRLFVRLFAALSTALVALYEQAAEALRSIAPAGKVYVLHNWVQVPDSMVPPPAMPPLRVAFVGGVVRRKGAPQLIEAMRLLDRAEVTLRLTGGSAEDGIQAFDGLQVSACDLVADGRVTFVGELDPAGVRAELRVANLFALPSDAEGMPLAMLEALAEGRPVLVTDAGNMAQVVRDTRCGWLLPDRAPATIAAVLRELASDEATLADASDHAWTAARERYSLDALMPEIEAILEAARAA